MNQQIIDILETINPHIQSIKNHGVFKKINSIENLKIFMEYHVFAVWDFMCLLKELHRSIVCVSSPWFPPKDALSANLISNILVEEEGDLTEDNETYQSHFDIYLRAMDQVQADKGVLQHFMSLLKSGISYESAIDQANLKPSISDFIKTTFSFFNLETHQIASTFVFGREGITSEMFSNLVLNLKQKINTDNLDILIFYCERHIELDENKHFPMGLKMLENLAGDSHEKWQEIKNAAILALDARIRFLTSIENALISEDAVAIA